MFELRSDIGGGKTSLAKGIAEGMGIGAVIQSPTFTISREYTAPSGIQLHHYDFYRLHDPGIMSAELAESLNNPKVVTIIEWADTVTSLLPERTMTITINFKDDTTRRLTLVAPQAFIAALNTRSHS